MASLLGFQQTIPFFDETEAHFVEAAFYEDLAPAGEASTSRTIGTPLPAWEDIRDHPEADLRNILEAKKETKRSRKRRSRSMPQMHKSLTT
jgi:hypothetical protein